jgi:hypothetical protein
MPGHLVHGVRAPTYKVSYPGGTHKQDQESIAHIIMKAPNMYQTATEVITTMKATEPDALNKVKKHHQNVWKRQVATKSRNKGNEALAIVSHHKAADCFEKKSFPGINGKKDSRKCFNCNMRGHIARDCPRREERAESLFVGTVATEGNNSPNSANNEEFNTWWIDNDTIFNEMSFPEEGLRIVKGFDKMFVTLHSDLV